MTFLTETIAHTEATSQIVQTVVRASEETITTADLEALILTVRRAMVTPIEPAADPVPKRGEPLVTAKRSVTHDAVTCMTCGFVGKSMKRHLLNKHGQTPEQYREHWGLAKDHPIVAPGYTEVRSALAKANGLGRKSK